MRELEKHIEFLLSAALRKCGSVEDAQDLTQETLLSALLYTERGHYISEPRGWLLTVMNRKYYDMLRKRYKQPFVSIGEDFDIVCDTDPFENIGMTDEAENVRREVAYLASIYREVIIRHYMDGQSVADIAKSLRIPEGTVKSRLSSGRENLKKGIDEMESYGKRSYEPVRLEISNSGNSGLNGEPHSLANGDLIAQNLLYLAYDEPVAETELAKAIGIPAAYIEPIIARLVDGELMKRTGNKVYTDFIIFTNSDKEKYIPAQNEFVISNFELIWKPFEALFDKLRKEDFYQRMTETRRSALELFCFFNIFDHGSFCAFSNAFDATQIIPDRKNGGKWIAFGHVYDKNEDHSNLQAHKYSYAGQRNTWLENYLGAKQIRLSLFDPDGFPVRIFHRTENGIWDENLIKLLYIIESGIDFRDSGFDERHLSCIPWLVECNILHYENGKPELNIPVFSKEEIGLLDPLVGKAQSELAYNLESPLKEFLSDKKKEIPAHLTGVPLQKQYMFSYIAMLMSALRLAMQKGLIYDGGYYREVQCPYPMILVIDK
jgi:RNA polymerase sigma factor (sigma-70 family)